MKTFKLNRLGNLYFTEAAFKGPSSISTSPVLIDTGASYTLVSPKILQALGCDLSKTDRRVSIITASAEETPFLVELEWIQALGLIEPRFSVIAYALPASLRINAVLGMDFLVKHKINLDLGQGIAQVA